MNVGASEIYTQAAPSAQTVARKYCIQSGNMANTQIFIVCHNSGHLPVFIANNPIGKLRSAAFCREKPAAGTYYIVDFNPVGIHTKGEIAQPWGLRRSPLKGFLRFGRSWLLPPVTVVCTCSGSVCTRNRAAPTFSSRTGVGLADTVALV